MKQQDETTKVATPEKELFVKMVITAWEAQNARVDKMLTTLTNEDLMTEVAPGRNRGIYLLGHMAGVNDAMIPLLGFGEKLYPQLESIFLKNPDSATAEMPTADEVREYWNEINSKLTQHVQETDVDDWFTRHNSVSDEDFAKEPHRNKLNILIGRANHQSYHIGQLAFLVKKTK